MQRRRLLRTGLALSTVGSVGCSSLVSERADGSSETGDPPTTTTAGTASARYIDLGSTVGSSERRTASEQAAGRPPGLRVIETTGLLTTAGQEPVIGGVALTVAKGPAVDPFEIQQIVMQWTDDTGTYFLAEERFFTDSRDGAFATVPIRDDDGSLSGPRQRLSSTRDRAKLVVDIGRLERRGEIAAAYTTDRSPSDVIRSDEGGLRPGATVLLRLWTESGLTRDLDLTVPETLARTDAP